MTLRDYKVSTYKVRNDDLLFPLTGDVELIEVAKEGVLEVKYVSKKGFDKKGNPRRERKS